MRFLGAKVVLTPEERGIGMYNTAKKLAEDNGWFLRGNLRTSEPDIHESTTAREIIADFKDAALDYWVTGYGTGGTVTGVARALKESALTARSSYRSHITQRCWARVSRKNVMKMTRLKGAIRLGASRHSRLDTRLHTKGTSGGYRQRLF